MSPCLSTSASVPPAANTPGAAPPPNIAPSTASSPPTTVIAASSSASCPTSTVAVASPCWRASPVSARTPSAGVGASCTERTVSHRAASVGREAAASAWRSRPRGPDGPGGLAEGCDRRRSGLRHPLDPPLPPHSPTGPATPRDQTGAPHDRPPDAPPGLLLADQSQAIGGGQRSREGWAIPLPEPPAAAVLEAGMAGDQRRYQEEGVGGSIQEPGPMLAEATACRIRPRLPESGEGARHPLRHLRRGPQ